MLNLKEDNIKSIVIFQDLKYDINKNIVRLFERITPSSRSNNVILIKVPEHAAWPQFSCRFNSGYSPEYLGQSCQHTISLSGSDVPHLVIHKQHSVR